MKPHEMILDGHVVSARFELTLDAPESSADVDANGTTAVPMNTWLAWQAAGEDVSGLGAIVGGDEDVHALRPHLATLPFVALHLPKFTDGRIYSHARRLRGIWGYGGTILVFGDVLRDQLIYQNRVGINAFYMAEGSDLRGALASFSLYSHFYQYTGSDADSAATQAA